MRKKPNDVIEALLEIAEDQHRIGLIDDATYRKIINHHLEDKAPKAANPIRAPKKKLHLTTFQIGAPATPNQGLRIGVTRHPPRGVPKDRWATDGYFDVWLPTLAPESKLVSQILHLDPDKTKEREKLFDRYERELLSDATGRQTVELIARIGERTPVSIGCFCEDESRCHRSRLFRIIQQHAASHTR